MDWRKVPKSKMEAFGKAGYWIYSRADRANLTQMKIKRIVIIGIIICGLGLIRPYQISAEQYYKCKNKNGKIIYMNTPCENDLNNEKEIIKNNQEDRC